MSTRLLLAPLAVIFVLGGCAPLPPPPAADGQTDGLKLAYYTGRWVRLPDGWFYEQGHWR